ncbi:MAG: hypothetical protein ACLQPD_25665 [Desulfomonilaceae bacterium]
MNKMSKKIDIMTIVVDSKEGISDSSVMKECNLPQTRLDSLFGKLAESGTIRHLSDSDIIKNREGEVWDSRLVNRYGSAQDAVNQVFRQIEDITFSNKIEDTTTEIVSIHLCAAREGQTNSSWHDGPATNR